MRAFRYLCWLYVGLIVIAILADLVIGFTTEYGKRMGTGCNFYDALFIGVECRGFYGAKAVELLLNWPLYLVYAPMFLLSSLWGFVPTVILWFPGLFLLVSYLRRRHAA